MKVALVGYGKMGRMVEEIALQRGHEIVARISSKDKFSSQPGISKANVCIEFSHPSCVIENIKKLAEMGRDIVVGTTGWYEQHNLVEEIVKRHNIGLLYASNFSLGVNLFLKLVAEASVLLDPFAEYDVGLFEAHHSQKADSPSGTGKAIAKTILKNMKRKNQIVEHAQGVVKPNELNIASLRCGSIPGTHSVIFSSPADTITLTHEAHNRQGFAKGAVQAAEWLQGKKGIFTIEHMLGDL
ncbi:MAG: 4-hydroxy-tetrahydrodipicolinate reductase [Parachlamydiaceae bacterium]|nr:4-hydroxy-tetrahydrodipicolinate reductase [Parachlamydiaceae bacterium]